MSEKDERIMTINMIKTPMANLQKEARYNLAKRGLTTDGKGGIKVRLVLDHSGSMEQWYESEAVQRFTEQALGLASALDDDGKIEAWYFSSDVSDMYEISLNPDARFAGPSYSLDPYYQGWVNRTHIREPWGGTDYVPALKAPVDFQRNKDEDEPALVIFQTDGAPQNLHAARRMLRTLSGDRTFFSFVVFGREKDRDGNLTRVASYFNSLDELSGRVRDNASVFYTGNLVEYAAMTDEQVYDGILGEFISKWLPQVL